MTLEEQIKIFEHNAEHERQEQDLQGCLNFRQLAEWLKELKTFRSGINCSTCKYREVDGIDHPCIYCHPSENRWEYGGTE